MTVKTVLIVDDDLSLCDNLEDILQDEGYEPFSAVTCADGLKLAQKRRPKVALLDLKLPDGQGTALLSDLKRLYPDCLCIIMTAYADLDSAVVALEKAAYHYLQKPVHPAELLRVLEGAFETIHLRELKRQAEEALRKNEELLRDFLDNANDLIQIVEPDGRFLYINHRWLEVLGYTADETVNLSISDTIHPDSLAHCFEIFQRILAGEVVDRFETAFVTKNGKKVYVEGSINCRFENGKPVNTRGIFRDITDRKQAEAELRKSKELFQMVFDGISDPLIMVDKNMKILLQNRASMKYFGIPYTTSCLNKKCHQVFNGNPDPCEGCNIPSAVSNGRHESFERKGFMDPERLELVVIYPIHQKDHQEGAAIIRISDVTRARQMERELMQADKMISLGVLVTGVAHEINNPNNFIMLNAPLLREAWESIVPVLERYYEENGDFSMGGLPYSEMRDEIPQLFSGIKEGSERIQRIVRDLKDYARQDGADMDQSVNINQVIKSSVRLVGNMIKKATKNFRVKYGRNLPPFKGNKQKLEQVMINLIQNACQALPDKEKGIFVTSSFDKEGGCVVVEVRDEGEGIPENLLPRIMDPFFTTKRSEGGTGLGMSVSSNIVKGHGGKIEVESEWGKGTAFRFFIPTMRIEEPAKILVVDDERAIRELLHKALGAVERYIFREASNGVEAFLKIGQEPPDLLILDVQMPDMDGVEVCRLIKENPALSAIKVIIITGFPKSSQMKEIARMGFDKILAKPFSIPALLNMVDEVLEV
jgi:PAS domain S-box-containing protein